MRSQLGEAVCCWLAAAVSRQRATGRGLHLRTRVRRECVFCPAEGREEALSSFISQEVTRSDITTCSGQSSGVIHRETSLYHPGRCVCGRVSRSRPLQDTSVSVPCWPRLLPLLLRHPPTIPDFDLHAVTSEKKLGKRLRVKDSGAEAAANPSALLILGPPPHTQTQRLEEEEELLTCDMSSSSASSSSSSTSLSSFASISEPEERV